MAHKLISHVINGNRFFVYKIKNIGYRERLFCILDTDKPYRLYIDYKELSTSLEFAPFIGLKGGFQLQEKTNTETKYVYRLETEEECKHHIAEVDKKRKIIDDMLTKFNNDVLLEYDIKIKN